MIYCGNCVGEFGACCDFCKFYDFNGNEDGAYTGEGYCNKYAERKDPEDVCSEFHCERA